MIDEPPRHSSRLCPAGIVAFAWLALLTGGCAGGKMTPVSSAEEFQEKVIRASKPALVEFYKGGCPSCAALDPTMDKLADEYRGRAVVAKFELMTPAFTITSPEVKERYDISFYPTVILFVDGVELKRWVVEYSLADYRKALDAAVGSPRGDPSRP